MDLQLKHIDEVLDWPSLTNVNEPFYQDSYLQDLVSSISFIWPDEYQ